MEQVVITAIAPKANDLYIKLCEIITDMDCYISQAQGSTLGKESTCTFLITGNWNNIAKLETACNKLSDKTTTILIKRTERAVSEIQFLPYTIQIIAVDQIGLLFNICGFLKERAISIENLQVQTYLSNYSGTPMTTTTLSVCIPALSSIAEIREQFLLFCEDLNIDGVLEPDNK